MIAGRATGISRGDVRVGQIAILLLFLEPLAVYVLRTLGFLPADALPLDTAPLAALVISLVLFVYLRIHIGRRWLFRLYPNWISNCPHLRIFVLCSVGLLVWYLLNVTILRGNVALYRFGYVELFFLAMLELYIVGDKAKAERDRLRDTIR